MFILMFSNVQTFIQVFLLEITRVDSIHSVLSFTVQTSRAVVKKKKDLFRKSLTIKITEGEDTTKRKKTWRVTNQRLEGGRSIYAN